ncbi:MAG: hypothetical protein J6L77_01625 [Coprococcus sp.]|nr:hypothetical protein [Coprococcus sp.]
MITTKVTEKQLTEWQKIYEQKKSTLGTNRISAYQLDEYFRKKYTPISYDNNVFREVVYQNAKQKSPETAITDIAIYVVRDNVFVGIDLHSGYFHVESKDIKECIPVWDDMFVKRGLNEPDLTNYVTTAQYVILSEK